MLFVMMPTRPGGDPFVRTGNPTSTFAPGLIQRGSSIPGAAGIPATRPSWDPFISEDPIGFEAGPNFYSYVLNDPAGNVDPWGLDVAVIYGAPQGMNRAGHIAIAVTGKGAYSSGTKEAFGSSAAQYVENQAKYRDSDIYILPTTPAQDEAIVKAFLAAAKRGQSATENNCSDIVGEALKAGGLIGPNAMTKLPGLIDSYMRRRLDDGRVSGDIHVPKGTDQVDLIRQIMSPFNPR